MGRLIIDGNSVFELDEECLKRRRPAPECDVEKYITCESFSSLSAPYRDFYDDKIDKTCVTRHT